MRSELEVFAYQLSRNLQLGSKSHKMEGNTMNHRIVVLFGVTLIAGLVFGVLVAHRFMSTEDSAGLWRDYTSAESLVDASDRIIRARYLDESLHVKPEISAATGQEHGSVSHLFRRFKVVESLKGDATIGEDTYVAFTTGYTTRLDSGDSEFTPFEIVDLSAGEEYLLFLRGTPRREGYPAKYGEDIQWAITGEPGIALMDRSGSLSFISTDRYKDDQSLGTDSGAPFVLSTEQIQEIVSANQRAIP